MSKNGFTVKPDWAMTVNLRKNDVKCHNMGVLIVWKYSVYVSEHIFVEEKKVF